MSKDLCSNMELKNFYYKLPEHLIAQEPLRRRDQARLMIVSRKEKTITHDVFAHVGKYLPPRSIIVLNDSKVIPARLLGQRQGTGGEVEIFLLKRLPDGYTYEVLMRPTRRLKVGETISFDRGRLKATIIDKENPRVRLNKKNIMKDLYRIGHMPLPPYIKRKDRASDKVYYQTVYAQKAGSVAAPTAGLHFSNRLLQQLDKAGHKRLNVTLHINYATFKPVEEKDIRDHKMHVETYQVTPRVSQSLLKAKQAHIPIVAVGTTSGRVLETLAIKKALRGETDIFIYPGYRFKMMDILLTNFHLPHSTLLMLVYALGGKDLMKRAYQQAVKQQYRFFSYGDAMLIL